MDPSTHIGIGAIIESHSGVVIDSAVLSNCCHGCTLGRNKGDYEYSGWKEQHICQRNTDMNSARMIVKSTLLMSRNSVCKNDLLYTNTACDDDSYTYFAVCKDQGYGFIPLTKEDGSNHMQKRTGYVL